MKPSVGAACIYIIIEIEQAEYGISSIEKLFIHDKYFRQKM